METAFMNSEKNKTFDPYKLLLNLSEKINLNKIGKYVALSSPSIYYAWKNIRRSYLNNKKLVTT